MLDKSWLGFQEAVALVRELRSFSDGKSMATVKRAIASGEIGWGFTEQYIIKDETRAHRELSESVQRDVARNFRMSGSALDIMRSRGQQGAHERAARRLRQMVTDTGSPEFYEALMSENIRISRKDLLVWLDLDSPQRNVVPQSNRRYSEDPGLVQEGVDGLRSNPPRWPNPHQAAIALQPRAKGASIKSTIDRLERAIRKALGMERPRKKPRRASF
jgi:hypothetical protein